MNEIISKAVYQLAVYFVSNQLDFNIALHSKDNWDKPFPENLIKAKEVLFNIINTDLEDSYIDESGNVVLTVGIDGIVYTKVLLSEDIVAIGPYSEPFSIIKNFVEEPSIINIVGSEERSMLALAEYNPHLFTTPPGAA